MTSHNMSPDNDQRPVVPVPDETEESYPRTVIFLPSDHDRVAALARKLNSY